jgi:hypothetical protein
MTSSAKHVTGLILACVLLSAQASSAQTGTTRSVYKLRLADTTLSVAVYENPASEITFFAPQNNEQTAIRLAKAAVDQRGGRLVVIESVDQAGQPTRPMNFSFRGRAFSADPNRIYTANGRKCSGLPAEVAAELETFAKSVLHILLNDRSSVRPLDTALIAVHNNTDSTRVRSSTTQSLSAVAFTPTGSVEFRDQAAGVYLANIESDPDNFVFLSDPYYVSFFASDGFNVVVQKPADQLAGPRCTVDDGSLSVYAAKQGIRYICLEADSRTGGPRQASMLAAVYKLWSSREGVGSAGFGQ